MVNQAWPVAEGQDIMIPHLTNAVRTVLMPTGFLVVLFTPIVSLDKYEYGVKKGERPRSEVEEQWHAEHHNIHGAGFVLAVVLALFWEAGFLFADCRWYFAAGHPTAMPWPAPARWAWCVLAVLRLVGLVLQAVCLVNFYNAMSDVAKLKEPRAFNYRKWICEYSCLVLGGMVMMYDAASVLVFAGHCPRSLHDWGSILVVVGVLAETLNFTLGFCGIGGCRWAGVIALMDFNKIDFESLMHYILAVRMAPPLLLALKQKSGAELMGIDIAQAGDTDKIEVMWHDLGKGLPKVQSLVACPGIVENVHAITFDELSDADLLMYHEDMARVLKQLPSAEVMIVPFGCKVYKINRRMPIAVLLLGDFAADLEEVKKDVPGAQLGGPLASLGITRQGVQVNAMPYWPWRSELWEKLGYEDVARDITEAVRARVPELDLWREDLVSQLASGADLRRLYVVLNSELAALGDYEVQFRGVVGGPPRLVAVTLKSNLEKAAECAVWSQGYEVAIVPTTQGGEGKLYHKLA